MSTWRRFGAQALLAAPGAWFVFDWMRHSHTIVEGLVGAGIVGGALLLGSRRVVAQIVGRGVGWALLVPALFTIATEAARGYRPGLFVIAVACATAAPLALARPMLETKEAKAEFAPAGSRNSLLFSATIAVAASLLISTIALLVGANASHAVGSALALGVEAVALLASGIGVARMRSWGIFLGAATAVAAPILAFSVTEHAILRMLLATAALPGVSMVLAIVAARGKVAEPRPAPGPRVRVSALSSNVRVASIDEEPTYAEARIGSARASS